MRICRRTGYFFSGLAVLVTAAAASMPVAGTALGAVKASAEGKADGWTRIVGSAEYTCGIRGSGTLWCWGSNGQGQLGIGSYGGTRSTPAQVGTDSDWVDVTGYDFSTCGVRAGGTLWCWGYNGEGQLGDGTESSHASPYQVGSDSDWVDVVMGKQHACAVRSDATLWCWGSNYRGALGDGASGDHHSPEQVGTDQNWSRVSAGWFFSCATRTDGTLWCWGAGSLGQLGDGSGADRPTPTEVGSRTDWADVTAGQVHACATRTDGSLWCWGWNKQGQLGLGHRVYGTFTPRQVLPGTAWTTVTSHYRHTCGVQADGSAWCWGYNYAGALGGGLGGKKFKPQQVGPAAGWGTIGAGDTHTCAAQRNGTAWCWGSNSLGQLGDGTTDDSPYPTRVRRS